MAKVIKTVVRHVCLEELSELDTSGLWLGSVAECSCGKRFERRDSQIDGMYWAALPAETPEAAK